MNSFDEMAKEVARGPSRREALQRLIGGLAGAALAWLGVGTAEADPGGNSACAHWCASVYPPGPLRGKCVSDAALCQSGNSEACAASLCYQCGPAASSSPGALCGTSTLRFCCAAPGGNITTSACIAGACSYTCATGYATCDPSDPCGTQLGTSENCNGCGDTCATGPTIAMSDCVGGACSYTCVSGYGTCSPDDPCGTQLGTTANCSGCGDACATGPTITMTGCTAGTCTYTCASGYTTCDPSNPCGTQLGTTQNCSGCGDACSGSQICESGRCCLPMGAPCGAVCDTGCCSGGFVEPGVCM